MGLERKLRWGELVGISLGLVILGYGLISFDSKLREHDRLKISNDYEFNKRVISGIEYGKNELGLVGLGLGIVAGSAYVGYRKDIRQVV
jgi:hypothetical protein